MEGEPAWKTLARQLAVEAPCCCERAGGHLAGARPVLAKEALVGDPQACRAWAQSAEGMVAEASSELAGAARHARAARLLVLALYDSAAHVPGAEAPPLSAADDSGEGEIVRSALAGLEDAAGRAGRACDHAATCRGFLVGVLRLLNHPHPLPGGVDGIFDALFGVAMEELDSARTLAQETANLVYDALLMLV